MDHNPDDFVCNELLHRVAPHHTDTARLSAAQEDDITQRQSGLALERAGYAEFSDNGLNLLDSST
jgi:hypothetical protein